MKTLTRVLLAFILSIPVLSYSQIGPPAPSPGIWAIIDTNYNVGTANQGYTTAKITLKNTTVSKITERSFEYFTITQHFLLLLFL